MLSGYNFLNFVKNIQMYKSIFLIVFSLLIIGACKNDSKKDNSFAKAVANDFSQEMQIPTKNGEVDTNNMAIITFEETTFDFGRIKEGDVINHEFKFKNTGNKDLFLLYHQATCGCTVPTFSKDPYKPGASGSLTIAFDSKGKKLSQNKKIKIYSNTFPNMTTLTLKGYVMPKEK